MQITTCPHTMKAGSHVQSLAPQLRALALKVQDQDAAMARQSEFITASLDMYNDVYEWAANTADTEASSAVLDILDRHLKKFNDNKKNASMFAPAPPAPKGVASNVPGE